jgi:hypothetical protein
VQAFHFTCAEEDERVTCNLWQVEQLFKEDETMEDSPMVTDISLKLELLCPSHNPVRDLTFVIAPYPRNEIAATARKSKWLY